MFVTNSFLLFQWFMKQLRFMKQLSRISLRMKNCSPISSCIMSVYFKKQQQTGNESTKSSPRIFTTFGQSSALLCRWNKCRFPGDGITFLFLANKPKAKFAWILYDFCARKFFIEKPWFIASLFSSFYGLK